MLKKITMEKLNDLVDYGIIDINIPIWVDGAEMTKAFVSRVFDSSENYEDAEDEESEEEDSDEESFSQGSLPLQPHGEHLIVTTAINAAEVLSCKPSTITKGSVLGVKPLKAKKGTRSLCEVDLSHTNFSSRHFTVTADDFKEGKRRFVKSSNVFKIFGMSPANGDKYTNSQYSWIERRFKDDERIKVGRHHRYPYKLALQKAQSEGE